MMMRSFSASDISHSVDEDCDVLAFYNDDEYVFIQRHQEHGHKDDEGIYIEYKDQLHSGYDVIERIVFSNKQIEISLSSPLYKLTGVDGFIIDYPELKDNFLNYKVLLEAMFDDSLAEVVVS